MIFLGDTAHPFPGAPSWAAEQPPWQRQAAVVNFEGVLNDNLEVLSSRRLFNHSSILSALQAYGVKVGSLANNHIMDLPQALLPTIETLHSHGIAAVGAGRNHEAAGRPVRLHEAGETYALMAFGWRPIQCLPASRSKAGVNPLNPAHVFESIRSCRADSASDHIVLLMHWNYEMELYPQPAHRELSFAAIDAGAALVVGHHPHRVGGIEFYKGKPIVYSLGNWWLPQGVFFGGSVSYQPEADLQLALEWNPGKCPTCHWFTFDRERCRIRHLQSEEATSSRMVQQVTPFSGMSHSDYRRWFVDHRIKQRWLLPIYSDYRYTRLNFLKDYLVLARHAGLRAAEATGLRSAAAKVQRQRQPSCVRNQQ